MCYHRRLVFACSHHAWLGLTQPCELEKSFDRGEVNTGCSVRWSHGYDTICIQGKCTKCIQTQAGDSYRFGIVKERLKVLKEHIQMIKGARDTEGETKDGETPSLDSDGAQEEGPAASSSPGGSDDTGDTLFEESYDCLDEKMEEVRVDPNHRALKLPQFIAGRMVREVKAEAAVVKSDQFQ